MKINVIADKVIKEGDINKKFYTSEDRITDINSAYLFLIEKATQIGSKFPMNDGTTANSEIFTVAVEGDQTFVRTIKDVSIEKVEYRAVATDDWVCLDRELKRCLNCFTSESCCDSFTANEKKVFVLEADVGEYQVTYERGNVTLFTDADYTAGTKSPDWLPEAFHDLLWLRLLLTQTAFYKKERYPIWEKMWNDLFTLFQNHYYRNAEITEEIITDEPLNNR